MSYLAKGASPVVDFATDFGLLHFPDSHHDLLLNARAQEDLNRQRGAAKFIHHFVTRRLRDHVA